LDAAVVELDALADPVRAPAQDENFAALAGNGLVLAEVVGAVEVGRGRGELARARVNHAVGGPDAQVAPKLAHARLGDGLVRPRQQAGDLRVAEAEALEAPKPLGRE